jgi:methylmalonyl-CoA/ethylmalonyl-CoA epimerase
MSNEKDAHPKAGAFINHLAVAVPDLDVALAFYRDALGLHVERVEDVPREDVRVAFLPLGDGEIELVQPTKEGTGISKWLGKHGAGMHHMCIQVDDIMAVLARLKACGVELINPEPVQKTENIRYAFIHPRSACGVLVELYEVSEKD